MGSDRIRRLAPLRLARTMVRRPMMPPPMTSTVAPRGISKVSRPARQQAAGSVRAAVTGSSPSGSGCTQLTGSATRSAKPPTRVARGHCDVRPASQAEHSPQPCDGSQATRRPSRRLLTPRPTSCTTPEYSWPSTSGGVHGKRPWVAWMSVPQMPAACTDTTTWPGPAAGSGASSMVKRVSPCQVATFMTPSASRVRPEPLDREAVACRAHVAAVRRREVARQEERPALAACLEQAPPGRGRGGLIEAGHGAPVRAIDLDWMVDHVAAEIRDLSPRRKPDVAVARRVAGGQLDDQAAIHLVAVLDHVARPASTMGSTLSLKALRRMGFCSRGDVQCSYSTREKR